MHTINIGGVPEHFNLPWHLSIEKEEYLRHNIHLKWKDFPGGTGAMCTALRNGEIDMAIILTEGIIKDIIDGNPSKIIQTYVKSPLIWGVHVSHSSSYQRIDDLQGTAAAISRYGSGSHLMAYVFAKNNNWNTDQLKFEVVKNLDGAVQALTSNNAAYFMWEHFTTKPLVDNKVFRRITDCPTPWPCFVIAVREEILESKKQQVKTILGIINSLTLNFKKIPNIDKIVADRYHQQLEDIQEWMQLTSWSQSLIQEKIVQNVQNELYTLKIIHKKMDYDYLVSQI